VERRSARLCSIRSVLAGKEGQNFSKLAFFNFHPSGEVDQGGAIFLYGDFLGRDGLERESGKGEEVLP